MPLQGQREIDQTGRTFIPARPRYCRGRNRTAPEPAERRAVRSTNIPRRRGVLNRRSSIAAVARLDEGRARPRRCHRSACHSRRSDSACDQRLLVLGITLWRRLIGLLERGIDDRLREHDAGGLGVRACSPALAPRPAGRNRARCRARSTPSARDKGDRRPRRPARIDRVSLDRLASAAPGGR